MAAGGEIMMPSGNLLGRLALSAACILAVAGSNAFAAEDFYKGKTVKIIAGAAAGGGYDSHARLLAKHLPKHIPGNPAVIVNNLPAAGGLVATNHVYAIAEKDGTEIGLFNRYTLLSPLLGQDQAKYKVDEFHWLGTPASYSDNAYLFVIRSALPHKTVDDLRKANPPIAVGNVGSAPVRVLQDALGLNLKIIEGYKGSSELDLAFERGEVDGHTVGWANMLSRQPEWINKNFIRPMVQFGRTTRLPALADVPTARELTRNPEDLALIQFTEVPLTIGFPFAAPPGVPADRVKILKAAFQATFTDPDYKADVEKSKLEYTPKTGDDVQGVITSMAKTPSAVVERYKKLVGDSIGG
jgi:tripartite-type tricarboxylate transporter receptor subunit TctC